MRLIGCEIDDIDEDKRSMYFKQAAYGVPVRMALIASLLELDPALATTPTSSEIRYPIYSQLGGIECSNAKCVSRSSAERRYLSPRFWILQQSPPMLRCAFCDVEQAPHAVGSVSTHKFTTELADWQDIQASECIFFADETQAAAAGYTPRKASKPKKVAGSAPAAQPAQ